MIVELNLNNTQTSTLCQMSADREIDIPTLVSMAVSKALDRADSWNANSRPKKDDFSAPIGKTYQRAPAIGSVIMSRNQKFEVFRCDKDQGSDGRPRMVITWESSCAKCGDFFYQETDLKIDGFQRRCKRHAMTKSS